MGSIRKKIQAQASVARANIDAAILGLRHTGLDQLVERLEQTRTRLGRDGDMAWSLATRVLAKLRAVRESLQKAAVDEAAKSTTKKAKSSQGRQPKTRKALTVRRAKPAAKSAARQRPKKAKPRRRSH